MAFSAQSELGQNERKEDVLSDIEKLALHRKERFVPNPAAKPFIPNSCKVTQSCRTQLRKAYINAQPSSPQVLDNVQSGTLCPFPLQPVSHIIKEGHAVVASQVIAHPSLMTVTIQHPDCTMNNVMDESQVQVPTTPVLGKHIALHLLSKVLDDESIFNFSSFDESAGTEPFSPLAPECNQAGFDNQAWSTVSADVQPIPPTTYQTMPAQENIWSSNNNTPCTPPESPILQTPPPNVKSPVIKKGPKPLKWTPHLHPVSSNQEGLQANAPVMNGYHHENIPSPLLSPYSPSNHSVGSYAGSPYNSYVQSPQELIPPTASHFGFYRSISDPGYYNHTNNPVSPTAGHVLVSPTIVHSPMSNGQEWNSVAPQNSNIPENGHYNQYGNGPLVIVNHNGPQYSEPQNIPQVKYNSSREMSQSLSPRDHSYKEGQYLNHVMMQRTRNPCMTELYQRIEMCYEQLRCLEKERRKAEMDIASLWPGRRMSGSGNPGNVRLPPNPSRVDKLIVDHLKEHAKIEALVGRIERIRHSPLHVNVGESVDQWLSAIRELQARRKDEIHNSTGRTKPGTSPRSSDEGDIMGLVVCIREVGKQTRSVRTTIWCAVQLVTSEFPTKSTTLSINALERKYSSSSSGEHFIGSPG